MKQIGYIGLDVGTSGCKASVINEKGVVLANARNEYGFSCPQKGEVELDPRVVWQAVKETLAQITNVDAELRMVAVSSIGETLVMLDKNDRVVRNGITYLDERGAETCDVIRDKIKQEEIERITGMPLRFFYSLNRLLWMAEFEPKSIERTDKYFLFGDFITYMLCGERVVDVSSASKTFMVDVRKRIWSKEVCALFSVPLEKFSKILPTGARVGKIRKALADELGLPRDLEVVVGSHDQCASALGSGAIETGDVAAGEGSTESLNLILGEEYITGPFCKKGLCYEPYIQSGKFLVPVGQHMHGTSIRWFVDKIGRDHNVGQFENGGGVEYENIYKIADENCAPETHALFFVPHLTSAHLMDPDNVSLGAFLGMGLDTNKAEMYRAVLEGICFETKICFDIIKDLELPINKVVASGGCSKSEILMQMKADILEVPLDILGNPDAGISALAMICAIADGQYKDYRDAAPFFVKTVKRYVPKSDYREKYQKYLLIYNTLKELYNHI